MKRLLAIFLLALPLLALAKKKKYNWMNGDEDWRRVKLEWKVNPAHIGSIDTALVVASNRLMQKDSLRFMCEKLQKDRLHYFFVYVKNGTWHAVHQNNLYDAIQHLPNKDRDWLVYTEGMGKVFTTDLDRGITVGAFYGVNVLLLDYPSIHPKRKSLRNYFFAINHAKDAYRNFAPVFDTLKTLREQHLMGSGNLSVLFHSMGNNVMKEMVEHKQIRNINNTVWVDNLILNAPCVKQRKHRRWVDNINFAEAIYVHYNPQDRTLFLANLVSFSKQLGEQVKNPISDKAIYINFNTVAGENHSNFLPNYRNGANKPEVFEHYRTLFHGSQVKPGDNKRYVPTTYHKIGWDLLPDEGINETNQASIR